MNYSIYIVGAFAVLSILYYIFVVPMIKAKYQKSGDELRRTIMGKEEDLKKAYLSGILKPVADAIGNNNIIGLTECMEYRTTGDVIKDAAINTAGKAVAELAGIGFKVTNNNYSYYLALTNAELYYLAFKNDECIDNRMFTLNELSGIEFGKGNIIDQRLKGGASGAEKLIFSHQGKKFTFYYFKQICYLPDQQKPVKEDYSKLYICLTEPFVEKIATLKA